MQKLTRRKLFLTLSAAALVPGISQAAAIGSPSQGKGMIVVYRPRRAKGGALLFPTLINGQSVGNLTNGRIVTMEVSPGQHSVSTSSASVAGQVVVSPQVAAGQTVFVRAEAKVGYPAWRPALAIVSEQQGRSDVAAL